MPRLFRKIFKDTTFEKGLAIKEFTEISSITENQKGTLASTEKATVMCHWKDYDDGWWITENATLTSTKNATLTCHWKDYDDRWQITEKATPTWTKKATLTSTEKATLT
jgi:hypothetical protein